MRFRVEIAPRLRGLPFHCVDLDADDKDKAVAEAKAAFRTDGVNLMSYRQPVARQITWTEEITK